MQELPLDLLGGLIKAAQKKEQERQLLPLWLAHNITQKLKGETALNYTEFLQAVEKDDEQPQAAESAQKKLSAEDIINEFAPIIAADGVRRTKRGEHI